LLSLEKIILLVYNHILTENIRAAFMDKAKIIELINQGEDSRAQFKENFTNSDQLAAEMVAFSNAQGGCIIIGVSDDGDIKGLSKKDIQRLNQLISNTATENIKPLITPLTGIVTIEDKLILVIEVKKGINKPYCTNKNVFFTKVGADKRKISCEELLRLFQDSGHLSADEMLIPDSTVDDINYFIFNKFFEKNYEQSVKETGQPIEKLLENLKLFRDGKMNLAGLLLFGLNPQKFKPIFIIKAVSFFGNDIAGTEYRNSEDIDGDIETLYKNGMGFLLRNLDKTQQGQDFNTLGILEVSKIALQEVLQNALIHRSYFKNAPVRLLVFDNRIKIISPGKLPNGLTVENIKYGNAVARNYILASFASKILPYRGLGTGIKRAIKEQPDIEFINDAEGEQFIVIIPRPKEK
jgi:predicted HTH transcriptional regulator